MDPIELINSAMLAIKTNKTRSVLTTLGIIIGVASVILLVSIGTGLQAFVTSEFESLGSNIIFIAPGRISFQGGPPQNTESKFRFADLDGLEALGEPIVDASALISRPTTSKYQSHSYTGSTITGVDEKYLPGRDLELAGGQFFSKSAVERGQLVAVIGWKVKEELFGKGEALGKTIDVASHPVKVVAVLADRGGGFGGASEENNAIFVPVTAAVKITGINKPAALSVETSSAQGIPLATLKIKNYFYRRNFTDDDFTVTEPTEILSTINSFLGTITAALSGIAAISLLVGGIGIANIMLVSVTERTREIGLRKAVGATRRDIMLQFLVEAIVLSLIGGSIGIIIGWGGSAIISQFIQTSVTWTSVALAFGVSAVVGIVSGLVPAIRAARLNPIDALRYE